LINLGQKKDQKWKQMIALIHILDHAQRFYERCTEEAYRAKLLKSIPDLCNKHQMLIKNNRKIITALHEKNFSKARKHALKNEKEMKKFMKCYREMTVEEMVSDKIGQKTVTNKFEAVRWVVRVSHHISRICYHMEQSILETAK
jgi:phosphate:Na+ symporter